MSGQSSPVQSEAKIGPTGVRAGCTANGHAPCRAAPPWVAMFGGGLVAASPRTADSERTIDALWRHVSGPTPSRPPLQYIGWHDTCITSWKEGT